MGLNSDSTISGNRNPFFVTIQLNFVSFDRSRRIDPSLMRRQQKEGGGSSADIISFNPKPDDFDGVIKVLLQTYLDTKVLDLSGFVDLILQQVTVGTIIKIDEDDSVYDFVTTLNLKRCKDRK